MSIAIRDDLLQVRGPGACFYVLRDGDGLYLIDTGFVGGHRYLIHALHRYGWKEFPIKGIIVTHGHIDHVLNVDSIARATGAWVAAPALDRLHYEGRFPYRGWSRVCGLMEAMGRTLLGYNPFTVDRWLDDGTEIPVWHGLRAIHLPGHTDGHTGYYCEKLKLLFCADLLASFRFISHRSPVIFNSNPPLLASSMEKALSLDLIGILPSHCDTVSPGVHLQRLRILGSR